MTTVSICRSKRRAPTAERGTFDLIAQLLRAERTLDLTLALSEAEAGIAARLLDIPDQPSVDLTVRANGPIDDLVTDLSLETDGEERLAGQIQITALGDAANPDRRIRADIGGDITAVTLPEYRDFFGPQVSLTADALLGADGAVALDSFDLQAASVDLSGQLRLSEARWPSFIDIEGTIGRDDGAPLLLPGGGGETLVSQVTLRVDYDASAGEAYEAVFDIVGLETSAAQVAQSTLRSTGTLTGAEGNIGQLLGQIAFQAQGLALTDPALAEALGTDISLDTQINYIEDQPLRLSDLTLEGSDFSLSGDATFDEIGRGLEITLDTELAAQDISRFSALAGRELDGSVAITVAGDVTAINGAFDLALGGTADAIKTGIAQADALLEGRTDLELRAIRNANGTFVRGLELSNAALLLTGEAELASSSSRVNADVVLRDIATVLPQYEGRVTLAARARENGAGWIVDVDGNGPYDARIAVDGLATGPDADLNFTARVPRVSDFAAGVPGALSAAGNLRQTPQGWLLQTDASGPYDATARLNGLVTPALDLGFDLTLPDAAALAPQVQGPLRATGRLRQTPDGFEIETDASGPFGADVSVSGALTPALDVNFDLALPDVSPFAPGVRGGLRAQGDLRQTDAGFAVDATASAPYNSRATVEGVVTGPDAQVDFTLALPNIASVVPQLAGPLNVEGSAQKVPQGWRLDTDLRGPSGTTADIAGLVGADGQLDIDASGNLPLGLSAPFIAPRVLQGQAQFDLSLDGPAGLDALSGVIRTSDATLTAPNLRIGLENIAAEIRLANSRAQIDISADANTSGQLAVQGEVGLTGARQADIAIRLDEVVLIDPRLYRIPLSGALSLTGPLAGGATIAGDVRIGESTITVPSTGLTSIGEIPPIDHIGAPQDNRATRRRAGLLEQRAASDPAGGAGPGGGFGLDIALSAPGRIFVRGRGIDAELGGSLRITGTTTNIISAGRFELERGRIDILGKRFDLEEGTVQFQGSLVPFIRFVSTTSTRNGTATIIVEGPADAPEVRFESNPAGPQDEVLAQLLFGRSLSEISAFQALQLANAVATLAGRGGVGVVGNLRDRFGLDDLDVTTTDSGETALRVGKYISDNVYTDVTAASDGTGEVSLNIDLTDSLKGKATLGSDGNSALGIFFERDY